MRTILILLTFFIFVACGGHIIKAPLVEKLQPYKETQIACDQLLSLDIDKQKVIVRECNLFIDELYKINAQFAVSHDKDRGNFTETRNNINFAKKSDKLKQNYQKLTSIIAQEAKKAMEEPNVDFVKSFLNFPHQTMNLDYYTYFTNHPSAYNEAHFYLDYKTELAKQYLNEARTLYKNKQKRSAFKKLQLSANMQNREAMQLLAQRYAINKKYKSAIKWYKKLENSDSYAVDLELAKIYELQKNYKKALLYYQKSAITLDGFSEYKVYLLLHDHKVDDDQTDTANNWLARSARHDYVQSQYLYGLTFLEEKQIDEAIKWLRKASEQDYSDAYLPLAQLYFDQKEYDKALHYLTKGTLNASASYTLGLMYENALGVPQNYPKAYELYTQAQNMNIDREGIDQDIKRIYANIMRPIKEAAMRKKKEEELKQQEEANTLRLAQEKRKLEEEKKAQLLLAAKNSQAAQVAKESANAKKVAQAKIDKLKKECPIPMSKRRFNYKMAGVLEGSIIDDRDGNYLVVVLSANRKATYYVSGFAKEELYRGTQVHWRVQSDGEIYTYIAGNGSKITAYKLRYLEADHDPCSPYVKNTQE